MALTKNTASLIVAAVSRDPESRRRIGNVTGVVRDQLGIAGTVRNVALRIKSATEGKDSTDKEYADLTCDGIAKATLFAIDRLLSTMPQLKATFFAERYKWGGANQHVATGLIAADDKKYVFDWHATLNLYNPLIYEFDTWMKDGDGVQYVMFNQFN